MYNIFKYTFFSMGVEAHRNAWRKTREDPKGIKDAKKNKLISLKRYKIFIVDSYRKCLNAVVGLK